MMMQRTHTSQSFRRWLSPNSINRWKQTNSYERRFFSEKTTQEAPKVTKEALIHEGKAIIKLFVSVSNFEYFSLHRYVFLDNYNVFFQ
jgi:hypothetical protein